MLAEWQFLQKLRWEVAMSATRLSEALASTDPAALSDRDLAMVQSLLDITESTHQMIDSAEGGYYSRAFVRNMHSLIRLCHDRGVDIEIPAPVLTWFL